MALTFARHLSASVIVFDCMDELSAFQGCPAGTARARTGAARAARMSSLLAARVCTKRSASVIVGSSRFRAASTSRTSPGARLTPSSRADQATHPAPRLGFFGVVDERIDWSCSRASRRPGLIGISSCSARASRSIRRRCRSASNIHYLGMKTYDELPQLSRPDGTSRCCRSREMNRPGSSARRRRPNISRRDVRSCRHAVRDVVRPYGERGFVCDRRHRQERFVAAIDRALAGQSSEWREEVDRFLAQMSWDRTWDEMCRLIDGHRRRSATLVNPAPDSRSAIATQA